MIRYVIVPFHGLSLERHFSFYSAALFTAASLDEGLCFDEEDENPMRELEIWYGLETATLSGVHFKYFDPFKAIAETPFREYGQTEVIFKFDEQTSALMNGLDAFHLAPSGYIAFEVEDETSMISQACDNDARLTEILRYAEKILDTLCLVLGRKQDVGRCDVGYLSRNVVGAWVGRDESIELIARSAAPLRLSDSIAPLVRASHIRYLRWSYEYREIVTPCLDFHLEDKAWLAIFEALHRWRHAKRLESDEARFLAFLRLAEDLSRQAHSLEKETLIERVAELAEWGAFEEESLETIASELWRNVGESLRNGKTFAELGRDATKDLAAIEDIAHKEILGLYQQKLSDDLL
ncbi:MAG: hypothetical protein NZM06_08220 [Chloroherpetonaceae bacterium]|nr:hypothetical protein [Chloroherpetonaceae bacterium]MDW8438235.1 hypothetical protein [Chloroherpetonaceae bacterium]